MANKEWGSLFDWSVIETWFKVLVAKYLIKDGPVTGSRVHEGLNGTQRKAATSKEERETKNAFGE